MDKDDNSGLTLEREEFQKTEIVAGRLESFYAGEDVFTKGRRL
uniref:Uncharacterized protein n=1 Tax=Nelumbo nucifera TaxID=4432 RepID=A0A822Y960_NELNU|nr:TPA_asm: hypothetical protein HUJ06_030528 [Nelumbo nucifera]